MHRPRETRAGTPPATSPTSTLDQGLRLHQSGRLTGARQTYLELLRTDPVNADAWHLLGVIALQLGEPGTAVSLIAKAIEFDAHQPVYFNNLGNALFEQRKLEDAAALYRHAIGLQPDYAEAIYNLGNTLQILEQYDAALNCYREAVGFKPNYTDALYSTARLYQARGDYTAAASWYRRLLKVDPDYSAANLHLGRLLFLDNRLQEAQQHYKRYKQAGIAATPQATTTDHLVLELSAVKNWCARSGSRYECVRPETEQEVAAPRFYDPPPAPVPASRGVLHELYLAQLSRASVIGWSDVVLAGDGSVALYDMATRNPDDAIEAEHRPAHYVSPTRVLLDGLRAGGTAFDRGVLIAGRGRDSYAHWLIDFLPRLWILNQFPEYDDWPLLIDAGLHSQQVESLQHLNHRRRPLVVLGSETRYEVEQLVLVSDLSCMRRQSFRPFARPSGHEVTVSPDALAYLRAAFAIGAADRPGSRCLYVSRRRQTKFRRLQNEAELEQLFVSHGFEVVYPELLSHAEQVTLFSEARIIAGAAGSNMINTVFSPRGAKILMLAQWNAGLNYYFFPHLAALCGQQLTYVLGAVAQRHAYHYQHDFTVDPVRVTRALEDMLDACEDEQQ